MYHHCTGEQSENKFLCCIYKLFMEKCGFKMFGHPALIGTCQVHVILFEIDCAIFYTNLHELFCQFISWTNWVNSGKFMDNCWISCQVMADMKKVYDDLIIINLYESPFVALLLAVKHINLKSICLHYFPNRSCLSIFSFSMLFFLPVLTCLHTCFPAPPPL